MVGQQAGAALPLLLMIAIGTIDCTSYVEGSIAKRPLLTNGIVDLDLLRLDFINLEHELWQNISDPRWKEVTSADELGPDMEIAKVFRKFADRVEKEFPHDKIDNRGIGDNSWQWGTLSAERMSIDKLFETFRVFLELQETQRVPSDQRAWLDLAETIVDGDKYSVISVMERVHRLVTHGDLYRHASITMEESDAYMCGLQQSPHQLLFNMYNTIALTEMKGYAMMQFSWMLLKIYGKGNFTQEIIQMHKKFEERSVLTLAALRSVMEKASREVWRCDPSHHQEGETYVAVTRLLQGYIENEVDLNAEGTCSETCAFYQRAESHGCFKDKFCSRQPTCTGKIHDCRFIDSDMWICPGSRTSGRRYEWIEYESGAFYGKRGSCMNTRTKVDSWWRWLFWHCSYCMCLCDQAGPSSDRYISLREAVSNETSNKLLCQVDSWWRWDLLHCSYCMCLCDEEGPKSDRYVSLLSANSTMADNKVVTGIRLIKKNRVIHLQISEGTLLPRGKIDQASIKWVAVPEMNVYNAYKTVAGRDYHTLNYENRAIDLDDLEGPQGHVLTGVRFRKVGAHLNMEIRTTPFNFTTGQLISPDMKTYWTSNDNTDAANIQPRTKVVLMKPDIPTRSNAASVPMSKSDQYIDFTHSDFEADAAQTTVPFLDAQPVLPSFAVPLSGAGLFFKGQPYFGGFITPKIMTYDFSRHMNAKFPQMDELSFESYIEGSQGDISFDKVNVA